MDTVMKPCACELCLPNEHFGEPEGAVKIIAPVELKPRPEDVQRALNRRMALAASVFVFN
jgi:hypothetical protein